MSDRTLRIVLGAVAVAFLVAWWHVGPAVWRWHIGC